MSERARGNGGGSPRSERPYLLVGPASTAASAADGCRAAAPAARPTTGAGSRADYATAARSATRRSIAVREDRILPLLDDWLVGCSTRTTSRTCEAILGAASASPAHSAAVARKPQRTIAEAHQKLDRYLQLSRPAPTPRSSPSWITRKAQLESLPPKPSSTARPTRAMPLTPRRDRRDAHAG